MLTVVFYNFPSKRGFPIIIDLTLGKSIPLSNPGACSQALLLLKNEIEEVDLGARKDVLNCRFRSDSHLVQTLQNLFPQRVEKKKSVMYLTICTVNQLDSFFFYFSWLKMYPTLIFVCVTVMSRSYVIRISKLLAFYYQNRSFFFLQEPKKYLFVVLLNVQQKLYLELSRNLQGEVLFTSLVKRVLE